MHKDHLESFRWQVMDLAWRRLQVGVGWGSQAMLMSCEWHGTGGLQGYGKEFVLCKSLS